MYSRESQLMGRVRVEDCWDEWGVVTTSKALTAQLKLRAGTVAGYRCLLSLHQFLGTPQKPHFPASKKPNFCSPSEVGIGLSEERTRLLCLVDFWFRE